MPPIPSKYYYLTLVLLSLCSLVGLYIAYRFQRDVAESGPTTEKEIASPLEKAYASGLMDEAEFRRIQESMRKLKEGGSASPPRKLKARPAEATTADFEPGGETTEEIEEGPAGA